MKQLRGKPQGAGDDRNQKVRAERHLPHQRVAEEGRPDAEVIGAELVHEQLIC
jgi:hypothetical protein